jgi:Tfp pilus assembly protein FimT
MTLTEVLIAVTILLMSMAIATPSLLQARETYELQSAARMVESRMQSARIHAVTRNRDCRINHFTVDVCGGMPGIDLETIETVSLPPA